MPCLKVIIAYRFTCGERKICRNIKKSQNIMKVVVGVYKLPNRNDIEFLNRIGAILDCYSEKYDNVTIIGYFSITTENTQFYQKTNVFSQITPAKLILY